MNTYRDLPNKILPGHLASFVEKMQLDGLDSEIIDSFAYYYQKVVNKEKGFIHDKDIIPLEPEEIPDLKTLEDYAEAGKKSDESNRHDCSQRRPWNQHGSHRP